MNVLLAMIPAFFWGSTYAVTQYTLPDWPPLLLGALRALPAGLLLLLLRPRWPLRSDLGKLLKLGCLNIGAFFCLIFIMAQTLPSAISGVGMVSLPIFAMVYHWLMYRTQPSWIQIASGALILLCAWQLFDPQSISLDPLGLVALVAAILCIVIGSTLTQQLGKQMHWWSVLTWQLIFGGLMLSVVAMINAYYSPSAYLSAWQGFSSKNALGLAWIILLNTALGYGLYVWLLQRMTIVSFAFGGIANPIAGIVFGVLLMQESYSISQYALMALMIALSLLPSLWLVFRNARH